MSKVTVNYTLKAPIGGDFSDQFAPRPEVGVIFERDVDDKTTDFQVVADELFNLAKIHVCAQLNIPTDMQDGSLQPVFTIANPPMSAPKNNYAPRGNSNASNNPTVTIDGVEYVDYRESASKQKNPRFPDFKTADGSRSEWLYGKNGETTPFYEKADAAGVL